MFTLLVCNKIKRALSNKYTPFCRTCNTDFFQLVRA